MSCDLLSGSESVQVFFNHLFVSLLPLEIQLSRVEGYDPNYHVNHAVCLSQAMTRISNVMCRGLLVFNGFELLMVDFFFFFFLYC